MNTFADMKKEKNLSIMRASNTVVGGNLLVWIVVLLEGLLLAYIYFNYKDYSIATKIICTSTYVLAVIFSVIRLFLFKKWKSDCDVNYKKILLFSNIYAYLLVIIGAAIMIFGATNTNKSEWNILAYLLMITIIPIVCDIKTIGFIVILCGCFMCLIVIEISLKRFNENLIECLYVLIINIFTVLIHLTKKNIEYKSYLIRQKALDTADMQIKISQELLKINEGLRRETMTDSLTQLFNRYSLEKESKTIWEECLIEQKPLCVCMLDVDNFKTINDTYGHSAGDVCLRRISEIIRENSISYNGMAFRYGGEEFLMIFKAQKASVVQQYMSDLAQAVANTYFIETPMIKVSISIGIYEEIPNDELCFSSFVTEADRRMYKNKNTRTKKSTR